MKTGMKPWALSPVARYVIVAFAALATVVGCWSVPNAPTAPVPGAPGALATAGDVRPAFRLPPAPAWTGPLPERLAGGHIRDWSVDRISSSRITNERLATHPGPASPDRKLQGVGASTPWGATGIALGTFGVTGVATAGPAWAYRAAGPQNLANRIWFVTTTGWLLGVDIGTPTASSGAKAYRKLNLGHPCTRTYVTLSDDGLRAYVVSDDGYLILADLNAMTSSANLIDTAADTSLGNAAFIDPLQSTFQASPNTEVVFAATNAGSIARFVWNGTTLTRTAVRSGVSVATALDGTGNLFDSSVLALGNRCYYGDRAGYVHILDFALAVGSDRQDVYLQQGVPIDAPVAIETNNALQPTDVFLSGGVRMAWVPIAAGNLGAPTVSPNLVMDCNVGMAPPSNSGVLSGYTYTNVKSVTSTQATVACTALIPSPAPAAAGMALIGGDTIASVLQSYRTPSVGGALTIDANLPLTKTIYGTYNSASDTKNQQDVTFNSGTNTSPFKFNTPLDICIGPEGEVYVGGKAGNDQLNIRMVPSINYAAGTGLFGYSSMLAGHSYLVAGPDGSSGAVINPPAYVASGAGKNPNTTFNQPHAVWYDENFTAYNGGGAGRSDDFLWEAEWNNNCIQRVQVGNAYAGSGGYPGKVELIAGLGGSGTHNVGVDILGTNAQLYGCHGIVRSKDGFVYFTEAGHNHLMRYDLATKNVRNVGTFPGTTASDVFVNCNYAPNMGTLGSVLCPSRGGHVIFRFDCATGVITTLCGLYGNTSVATSSGNASNTGCLNGPEVVCVHPTTGDVYIGEDTGARVKVMYASGPNAGKVYIIAGNGSNTYSGDGNAGPSIGLGWVSGLKLGPLNLATPGSNQNAALFLTSRNVCTVMQLIFPPPTAAITEGLMRWDLSAQGLANWYILNGQAKLTAANTTNAPRPDLVQADNFLQSTATNWTPAALVPNNTPTPNPAIKSTYITGVDGSTALGWTANTTVATYNVAYQQIPANANLTQALVPPSTGTYITHYPSGIGYTGSPVDVTAVDFNSLTTGTAANRPQLLLTASKYGSPNGILSPPVVYSTGANYVYVVNNNALFRLDYSSAANFANPANVGYSLTRIGRGTNGTIDTVSVPNNFISNPTPPLLTDLGSVYALDLKAISPGIWSFSLNLFNGLAAPGAMYSATSYNMDSLAVSVPTYQSGTYACYDSWGTNVGNAYFGLGNGNIYMVSL